MRRWFAHDPQKWPAFQQRCRDELDAKPESWQPLLTAAGEGDITLVYGARDQEHNDAVVSKPAAGRSNSPMTQPVSPHTNPLPAASAADAPGGMALLAGLWAGLIRLGWQLPPLALQLPAQHGPPHGVWLPGHADLSGAGGGVKARIRSRRRICLSPLLAGLGALALFTALPPAVPRGLSTLGALGLVLIFIVIYRLQPATIMPFWIGAAVAGGQRALAGRAAGFPGCTLVGRILSLTIAGEGWN